MSKSAGDIVINLPKEFGYHKLHVHTSKVLGAGSFGSVVRATLDLLPCAAKLLHTVFFQDKDPGEKNFAARFNQECTILQELKHPCIVQFLGVVQDPDNHRPILLMELMDESLTHYLEQSPTSLPYHVQVNITHDIALALDYLHRNYIIHRDLSSNNILLKGDNQAKVTDFGMSKMVESNSRMSSERNTKCPGTMVFMPPEALLPEPQYTSKLDTFSLGVLMIQIITRMFPAPSKSHDTKDDPSSRTGYVLSPVPEIDRRIDDISKVPSGHTLLRYALHCLKDKDTLRPTATQLCQIFGRLKKMPAYTKSVDEVKQGSLSRQLKEKDAEVAKLEKVVKTLSTEKEEQEQIKAKLTEQRKQEQQKTQREMAEADRLHMLLIAQTREQGELNAEKERLERENRELKQKLELSLSTASERSANSQAMEVVPPMSLPPRPPEPVEKKLSFTHESDESQDDYSDGEELMNPPPISPSNLPPNIPPPEIPKRAKKDSQAELPTSKSLPKKSATSKLVKSESLSQAPTPKRLPKNNSTPQLAKSESDSALRQQTKKSATHEDKKALFEAARKGKVAEVRRLIAATDVNVDCTPHTNGQTPLMMACFNGHVNIVKLLIQAKAQVNKQESTGWTALQMAAQEGKVDVVRVLIGAQADVNIQHESGQTAVYVASLKGHLQAVQLLLEKHADITICKKNGASPLFAASQEGHKKVVKVLIKYGANVNKGLNDGATPLYMACHNGHCGVVKTLLKHGADTKNRFKGWIPIAIAGAKGHVDIVKLLSEHTT